MLKYLFKHFLLSLYPWRKIAIIGIGLMWTCLWAEVLSIKNNFIKVAYDTKRAGYSLHHAKNNKSLGYFQLRKKISSHGSIRYEGEVYNLYKERLLESKVESKSILFFKYQVYDLIIEHRLMLGNPYLNSNREKLYHYYKIINTGKKKRSIQFRQIFFFNVRQNKYGVRVPLIGVGKKAFTLPRNKGNAWYHLDDMVKSQDMSIEAFSEKINTSSLLTDIQVFPYKEYEENKWSVKLSGTLKGVIVSAFNYDEVEIEPKGSTEYLIVFGLYNASVLKKGQEYILLKGQDTGKINQKVNFDLSYNLENDKKKQLKVNVPQTLQVLPTIISTKHASKIIAEKFSIAIKAKTQKPSSLLNQEHSYLIIPSSSTSKEQLIELKLMLSGQEKYRFEKTFRIIGDTKSNRKGKTLIDKTTDLIEAVKERLDLIRMVLKEKKLGFDEEVFDKWEKEQPSKLKEVNELRSKVIHFMETGEVDDVDSNEEFNDNLDVDLALNQEVDDYDVDKLYDDLIEIYKRGGGENLSKDEMISILMASMDLSRPLDESEIRLFPNLKETIENYQLDKLK